MFIKINIHNSCKGSSDFNEELSCLMSTSARKSNSRDMHGVSFDTAFSCSSSEYHGVVIGWRVNIFQL